VLGVNRNTKALTVERGFQGVARSWSVGTVIARNFTEYDYNALMENINTLRKNMAKTARFVVGTSTSRWTEKDCNYLCDGTNDQEEINRAIQDLPASGGEIIILDGTYNIAAKINVNKNNVSIKGNGNSTILKRMWDSSSEEGVITLNSVEGCRVQNLQIDGNKANCTSSNNYGIYLYSSNNNTITGNICKNAQIGISLYSSSNENTITGNTCNNNSDNGIHLYSSSNENTITGNTCNNNAINGVFLFSSSNNTVTGNTCNNNVYNGVFLNSSNNNTITGNTCNNNSDNGIHLYSSSNENTITGNTCNNNANNGIHLYSSNNNTITGNICKNAQIGISLYSSSNENTITGNTCNNNSDNGIHLYSSNNNNTITGNTCNNNATNGVFLFSSSNNTVTGNTCNNNVYNGVHLNSSNNNNTITGNTCIRGTGQTSDYVSYQHNTIILSGQGNNYNLISSNNCMGKAVVVEGGTGNSVWGNKFDATNNLPS